MSLENSIKTEGYNDTQAGVVTFLDVLGWKGIYNKDRDAIKKLINIFEEGKLIVDGIKKNNKYVEISLFLISDTIILLSHNTRLKNGQDLRRGRQFNIHANIASKLLTEGLEQKILLRGATSYGNYSYDDRNSIFMGEAIDEAAEWHEFTNWCGVILTPSAQMELNILFKNRMNVNKPLFKRLANKWVKYNKIPLKNKDTKLIYALNWTKSMNNSKILNKLKNNGPYGINIASKYLNTIEFVEEMENHNKESEELIINSNS